MTSNDPYSLHESAIKEPPSSLWETLQYIGPGFILSASIVGSGELIATTLVGARAGFLLLWFIIFSCLIKVVVQLEFGKHAISSGESTMASLNALPGPRWGRANWSIWTWLLLMTVKMLQVGGIVGGVVLALEQFSPSLVSFRVITAYAVAASVAVLVFRGYYVLIERASLVMIGMFTLFTIASLVALQTTDMAIRWSELKTGLIPNVPGEIELVIPATGTATEVDIANVLVAVDDNVRVDDPLLTISHAGSEPITVPATADGVVENVAVKAGDKVLVGSRFATLGTTAIIFVAIGAFGITGVGGDEIMAYNYWLIEKGYASYSGLKNDSSAWEARAKGWIRVMYWDALLAMVAYTAVTAMFYLLGAAVLNRKGLIPASDQLISTLGVMYTESLGAWARILFLIGAVVVLYSTLFAALAAWTRMFADAFGRIGLFAFEDQRARSRAIGYFAWGIPLIWATLFLLLGDPALMVILGGLSTTIILVIVLYAAMHFRYRRLDARLLPSKAYDVLLWTSAVAILCVAILGVQSIAKNIYMLANPSKETAAIHDTPARRDRPALNDFSRFLEAAAPGERPVTACKPVARAMRLIPRFGECGIGPLNQPESWVPLSAFRDTLPA